MARRRPLRPDEEELWRAVARTAQPLHPHKAHPAPPGGLDLPTVLQEKPPPRQAPLQPFRLGEMSRSVLGREMLPTQSIGKAPLHMDAKAFARMSRGKLAPEARIDLHGLTLAEAQPRLTDFILGAQAQGRRLVLVITGKGRGGRDDGPIPQRPGILRHQVPLWLAQAPLVPAVLQVAPAHLRHGGSGAFYVFLRRPRLPGPV
jgi:DNA-nicking Smr family endonuclease